MCQYLEFYSWQRWSQNDQMQDWVINQPGLYMLIFHYTYNIIIDNIK